MNRLIFLAVLGFSIFSCAKKDKINPQPDLNQNSPDPRVRYLRNTLWITAGDCSIYLDGPCVPNTSEWTVRNIYKFRLDDSVDVWTKHYLHPNDSSFVFTIPTSDFLNEKLDYSAYMLSIVEVIKFNHDTLVIKTPGQIKNYLRIN